MKTPLQILKEKTKPNKFIKKIIETNAFYEAYLIDRQEYKFIRKLTFTDYLELRKLIKKSK